MPPQHPSAPPPQDAATRDDLRSVKRWTAVAIAWAVAATAVALIALLDTSGNDAEEEAGDAASRVADLQRTLDRRLDNLESRLEGQPQSSDVSRLNDRLARVEQQSSAAAKSAKDAGDKLDDLEDRVRTLEDTSAGDDTTTTSPDQP